MNERAVACFEEKGPSEWARVFLQPIVLRSTVIEGRLRLAWAKLISRSRWRNALRAKGRGGHAPSLQGGDGGAGGEGALPGIGGDLRSSSPTLAGSWDFFYFCLGRTVELRWRRGYGFSDG